MAAPHGFQEEGRDPLDANVTREGAVVVGVDFGTLSGRALVVRVADGTELGTATHEYAHAVLDDADTKVTGSERALDADQVPLRCSHGPPYAPRLERLRGPHPRLS